MSTGYTPAQIRHAYGYDGVALTGTGETIAIIDSGDAPNLRQDLDSFDSRFGLPPANLTMVNELGGPTSTGDLFGILGWNLEITLDVEWAHAMAPGARILFVQAFTPLPVDLLTAVQYATTHGANVVSMSWGGPENVGLEQFDTIFNADCGFVASSGDSGPGVIYPASNPQVLAVGGTTLNGSRLQESPWRGSGGGQSTIYQGRTVPDVGFDADPATGVQVYCTSPNIFQPVGGGYVTIGGTSLGAPAWAGLVACADQSAGFTITNLPAWVSGLPGDDFNYIGGLTGRGTPRANLIEDVADSVFVRSEYELILFREPDAGGFTNWMEALSTGRLSRSQVDEAIRSSLEADVVTVELLYNQLLHRAPDQPGLAFWVEELQAFGKQAVIDGIIHSQEYASGG
jgi:hypothetical protein